MGRLPSLLLAAALGMAAPAALAWNNAGHRLTAAIAWDHLTPKTRLEVSRLLHQHPDFERWTGREKHYESLPEEAIAFIESATWADDIRHDPRFHEEKDGAVSAEDPGDFPDLSRHRDWHYDNQPLAGKAPTPNHTDDGQLSQQLPRLIHQLGNRHTRLKHRAYWLVWLVHLLGDIHQPLHVVSRFDEEGRGDAGGNGQAVMDTRHPRRMRTDLHSYWDDLPGPSGLRGDALAETAASWQADLPFRSVKEGNPRQWQRESLELARTVAYAGIPPGRTATLGPDYQREAEAVAQVQITRAGYRLARLLNRLLGP